MVIKYNVIENDEEPRLRWSNSEGWTEWETQDDYSSFSDSERDMYNLPLGGHWVQVSQYMPKGGE